MPSLLPSVSELTQSIISSLKSFIDCPSSCETYRKSKQFFSRESLISFPVLIHLLLSNMSNSLSVELYKLLDMNNLEQFTKSAFSQRRYQVSYKIFLKLNAMMIELFYGWDKEVQKYWHGFRLCAIDGSTLVLPKMPDIKSEFGVHRNGNRQKSRLHETVMGRFVAQYDLLNHLITYSEVHPIAKSELSIVYQWISTLLANSLTLFDRGFGSFALFYLMQKYEKAFVVRLKLNYNNVVADFVKSGEMDSLVSFSSTRKQQLGDFIIPKGSQVQLRLLRVLLLDGTVEVLATSLLDTVQFPTSIFAQLYHLRWGVETCFDRFKNKLLALYFTGHKAEAIYQEIYANVIVHNLHQLLVTPAQIIVNQKIETNTAKGKEYKHSQKINENVTIGILKPQLFPFWNQPISTHKIQELVLIFAKYLEPVRPNRTNKRVKSLAKRRNITTQTNYRRAA